MMSFAQESRCRRASCRHRPGRFACGPCVESYRWAEAASRPGSVGQRVPVGRARQSGPHRTEARAPSADAGSLQRAEEVALAHTSRVSIISEPPQSMNLLRFSAYCYRSCSSRQMREWPRRRAEVLLGAFVQCPKVALNLLDLFTTHQRRPWGL